MGMTLSLEEKFVYWIVRGSEGSNLYRAHMQGHWEHHEISVEMISSLQRPNIQGPLCYFQRRLLWLQDDKKAAISDLSGKNVATINGNHFTGLKLMHVVDPSLHVLPGEELLCTFSCKTCYNCYVVNLVNILYFAGDFTLASEIKVVPNKVDNTSIKVIGSSESFNITWDPITNVNYGMVFYEVHVESRWRNYTVVRSKFIYLIFFLSYIN